MPPAKRTKESQDEGLQLGLSLSMPAAPLSVTELTRRLQRLLSDDPLFGQPVVVEGEISNLKRSSRGHVYFTLKDEGAAISGVIWASVAARLPFELKEGMAVFATGMVDIYAPSGSYSLVVKKLDPVGMGALQLAFLQLKERLSAEGLFDENRKQPLPVFPLKVGIVTASTGAVIHDMLRVIRRKNPVIDVLIVPVKVQGDGAAQDIAQAIERLQDPGLGCDLLIVGRGGGSYEDLFCFSEEGVVRAIAASRLPVVTGIGHEPDFSLADAVADWSASTPTAAAEAAIPDLTQWADQLEASGQWLQQRAEQIVGFAQRDLDQKVEQLSSRLTRHLQQATHDLEAKTAQLRHAMETRCQQATQQIEQAAAALHAFSPLATLSRGYAVASDPTTGRLLTTVDELMQARSFRLRVKDGQIQAKAQ